jgi:hypothetical protein
MGGGVLIAVLSIACTFIAGLVYTFIMNASESKYPPTAAVVYFLVMTIPTSPPNTKQDDISKYFCSLEKNLGTKNNSVL